MQLVMQKSANFDALQFKKMASPKARLP